MATVARSKSYEIRRGGGPLVDASEISTYGQQLGFSYQLFFRIVLLHAPKCMQLEG